MAFRLLILGVSLAACAPEPAPLPPVQLTGAAANTSFDANAREVVDQVALNEHRHLIQ